MSDLRIKKKHLAPDVIDYFDNQIDAEASLRIAADSSLAAAVSAEESARVAADSSLAAAVSAEESARIAGDSSLQSSLSAEESARIAADSSLAAAVSAEESARIAADSSLQSSLSAEESARIAADSSLAAADSAEASLRIAADSSLAADLENLDGYAQDIRSDLDQEILDRQSAISAEASARIAGDSSLQSAISSEESARIAGDSSLQSQITTEKSRVDAILLASEADKDSFAEIVSLINSVDTTNDTAFASAVSSLQAVDSAEASLRIAADSSLAAAVSAEESARVAGDSSLQSSLSAEESARVAGDSSLQSSLSAEESARVAADSSLQSAVSALEQYAENIVHVDTVNGVDAVGRGSIMQPFKTINYAYSQVSSATSNLSKWTLEKLIIRLAPGDYVENVELGFKRARTAIMGEGVYINGTVTQTWQVADIPYSGSPTAPINGAAVPAPYTGFVAPTFELIGFGGGMEGGYVSKNLMIQGLVKIATIPWAANSSWQSGGVLQGFCMMSHVQLRGGFNVCHDISTHASSVGPAITLEVNSSSVENSYLGVAPYASGQQLTSNDINCSLAIKAHNTQLKSTLGPRLSIAEIDGCRIVNMDRTMGATVTNGSITGQNSSSFSGIVNSPFAGTVYKIGRSVGATAVAFKMDANSYADLQSKTIDTGTAAITYNLIDKASGVAVVDPATNYSRTANTVEAALEGIDNALGTQSSLRIAGDSSLQSAISSEASARIAGDSSLQSAISSEESARIAGDSSLQSQITAEKSRVDAILLASEADKDSFAEIVSLINSIDTTNDTAFASAVSSLQAADSAEASLRIAADSSLQSRISVLEAQTDGPVFEKQSFAMGPSSDLSSVELSHEGIANSLAVSVGRLVLHKDEDYSVSVVGGKTVLTWMGDFAVGGAEAITVGDVIHVTFARLV